MKRDKSSPRPEPPPGSAAPSKTSPPKVSGGKLWLFRAMAAIGVPLLLFAALELALRVGGYGFRTSFFIPARIGGENLLVENDKFGWRFFPPHLSRSPAPVVMKARKEAGTCRIFILGESAALGDPRPAFGPGRYLQALLQERCPGTNFEVVCVAMTAINSHAVLPIARECARHQGDVWIVYMGNNEYVGPFGATTVFGTQAPSRSYVRLVLAIQRTRVGQLLMAFARRLKGEAQRPGWAGMRMFLENQVPPADPRRAVIRDNFQQNLSDIVQTGLGAGAKVILNTVAVNLKDSPPFASIVNSNLPTTVAANFAKALEDASAAEQQGKIAEAATLYQTAIQIQPDLAQLHFVLGTWHAQLTNFIQARKDFESARDLDALPFRTTSELNDLTRRQAANLTNRGLLFVDAESSIARSSPDGIPGAETFYEHVHFNFDGNYRLARLWAEQVDGALPAVTRRSADWASQERCEARLGLTDWNRVGVYEDMLRRLEEPPFTQQSGRNRRLENLRGSVKALRERMNPETAKAAGQIYLAALKNAPGDHRLHENFAEFLEGTGNLKEAADQWQQVTELLPHHHVGYFQFGRLLVRQNRLPEGTAQLEQAVKLQPDLAEGWLELGKVKAIQGKPALALEDYERERKLAPGDPRVYYHIGKALSNLNRRSEAIAQLRRAIELKPDFWEAHYALGEELAFSGQIPAARAEFERVIALQPNYAMAHFNLGVALASQKEWQPAIHQFEETLRIDPNHKLAAQYLERIKAAMKSASGAPNTNNPPPNR